MTRFLPIILLICLLGCSKKDNTAPQATTKTEPLATKDVGTTSKSPAPKNKTEATPPRKAKTKRRPKLPPPLRPQYGDRSDLGDSPNRPCSVLVNKVCALLSEGAEECGEARSRLRNRPATLDQEQCREALTWFGQKIERNRRTEPCALLVGVTCRTFGQNTPSCANAKLDWKSMRKPKVRKAMGPACSANLLLIKGLGR